MGAGDIENSKFQSFFKGANVLITGATGFVGIGLIEKLLSCFPEIGSIYLLIRPRRNKQTNDRLEELKKNKIFERLRTEKGSDVFEKLIAINGDVGSEGLGLNREDEYILQEHVNVIFHCAATLDFEADLLTAVHVNLSGTKNLINLSKSFRHLKSFLHVSSAYVNAVQTTEVQEELYEPPAKVDDLLELIHSLDESAVKKITPRLIGKHPNTYTFTKALAEHEVAQAPFPTAIVRPSMIVGAWKEPVKGWTISKNGPQGFLMGAAKGVVRRLPIDTTLIYDYIPVDVVINYMIVSAWYACEFSPEKTVIFHCTTSTYKPFSWSMIEHKIDSFLHQYPLQGALWYPTLKFLPTLRRFRIAAFFFHIIPALVLDLMTKVSGGRPVLLKLHNNINRSLDRLAPFIFNQWFFNNTKALQLQDHLSDDDKTDFYLDVGQLDWEDYFRSLVIGVRTFLNNEPINDKLPMARRKDKILYVLNLLTEYTVVGVIWFATSYIAGSPLYSFSSSWILLAIAVFAYFF